MKNLIEMDPSDMTRVQIRRVNHYHTTAVTGRYICSICKTERDLEADFHSNNSREGVGRQAYCKSCQNILNIITKNRQKYAKNKRPIDIAIDIVLRGSKVSVSRKANEGKKYREKVSKDREKVKKITENVKKTLKKVEEWEKITSQDKKKVAEMQNKRRRKAS